jgi:Fe2+ transport system protein FeoA
MEVFTLQSLFDLNIGQNCKILKIFVDDSLKRRLIDIGVTPKVKFAVWDKVHLVTPRLI